MKTLLYLAAGALLAGGTALFAQQTQTQPQQQDQSVYQQQNPQDRTDQQQTQRPDRDQNWNRDQQVHRDRDRDQNSTNGQYANQDRDRVNPYNNGQNGTYRDQNRDRDQNGYNRQDDRERTYGYSENAQGDQDNSSMSAAQRSGWRDGLAAGRSDRASGRGFSPNSSATRYRGADQNQRLYLQGYRQGYQRGYYGNTGNSSPYQR